MLLVSFGKCLSLIASRFPIQEHERVRVFIHGFSGRLLAVRSLSQHAESSWQEYYSQPKRSS